MKNHIYIYIYQSEWETGSAAICDHEFPAGYFDKRGGWILWGVSQPGVCSPKLMVSSSKRWIPSGKHGWFSHGQFLLGKSFTNSWEYPVGSIHVPFSIIYKQLDNQLLSWIGMSNAILSIDWVLLPYRWHFPFQQINWGGQLDGWRRLFTGLVPGIFWLQSSTKFHEPRLLLCFWRWMCPHISAVQVLARAL